MNATSNWLAPVLRNRLVLFVLAIALLAPLAFTPLGATNPALGAALLEGCGIVLLAMMLWRADWRGGRDRIIDFFRSVPNVAVLLFFAVASISCMLSPHKEYSVQELLRLGSGIVLYFAIAHHVRRSDQLSCLVDVILFLCCAISIVGFAQFDSTTGTFAAGLFGDHQLYGSVLMALLPVAAAVAVIEKNPGRQLFARAATVLAAAGLLIAHSRSAWIGASVALVVLVGFSVALMMKNHRGNAGLRVKEFVFPVVVLLIALGFFMFMWPNTSTIIGRATSLGSIATDSTWANRQHGWAGTVNMISKAPWFGHGLGLYAYLQNAYTKVGQPIATLNLHPSLGDQAHNLYLQTAADIGIPGLLIFLAIPISLLVLGARRALAMDDGVRRTVLVGALAATVGCLVDALASPSWQVGSVSMFFWLLLGLAAASMQPVSRRERSSVAERSQPLSRGVFAFASLGLAALLPTAAMAAAPQYVTVVSCRIVPKTSTIRGGQAQSFTFFVTFASSTGNFQQERDVTTSGNTHFEFTTSGHKFKDNENDDAHHPTDTEDGEKLGFMVGNTYQSELDGGYIAFVTGFYIDPSTGQRCSDRAVVHVLRGPGHHHGFEVDAPKVFVGGAILFWLLTHGGHGQFIPPAGGGNGNDDGRNFEPGVGISPDSFTTPMPPDSLFGSSDTTEKPHTDTSGK